MNGLQTEFEFTLPKGYVDSSGTLHRAGTMRLATARDEIEPLRDPRVGGPDDPFLTVIVLSRVITRLGTLSQVTPKEIENLFAADLAFLQDLYGIINFGTAAELDELRRSIAGDEVAAEPEPEPEVEADVMPVATFDGGDSSDDDDAEELEFRPRRRAIEEVRSTAVE
jgi:hypothetical protein